MEAHSIYLDYSTGATPCKGAKYFALLQYVQV